MACVIITFIDKTQTQLKLKLKYGAEQNVVPYQTVIYTLSKTFASYKQSVDDLGCEDNGWLPEDF